MVRFESGTPYQAQSEGDFGQLFLTPRGELSTPDILQWDLSVTFAARTGARIDLELKGEIFNVTDEQERLASESRVGSGFFGLAPTLADLQAPRSYRLSLGLRF